MTDAIKATNQELNGMAHHVNRGAVITICYCYVIYACKVIDNTSH